MWQKPYTLKLATPNFMYFKLCNSILSLIVFFFFQKIQKKVTQEEAQLKLMSKHLKKQVAKNAPKLQEIHRLTLDMKNQKLSDTGKLLPGPDSLLKPAALLELETKPTRSSIKSVAVPAQQQPPPKLPAIHQSLVRKLLHLQETNVRVIGQFSTFHTRFGTLRHLCVK